MRTTIQGAPIVLAMAALAGACSPPDTASHALDGTSPSSAKMYVALMNTASKNDAEAYKIVAFSAAALDPSSVKFCFDQLAACQAGTTQLVQNGIAQDVGSGRKAYLTEKFIKLSANITFYVLAKDAVGAAITQQVLVAPKGSGGTGGVTPPGLPPALPPGNVTPPPVSPTQVTPTPPGPPGDPNQAGGNCYKSPDALTCQVENEIVRLTNVKRQTEGKGPLSFEPKLGYVARLWSVEQANRGQISHEWFENGTWGQKYQAEFNAQSPAYAENVAMNGGGNDNSAASTASAFVEQWWASPGHHANMVGNYSTLGVGVAKATDGSWYGTQDFGN